MTFQTLISLQNTIEELDFSSLPVSSKIKYYNILQEIQPQMDVYQSTLQGSILKEGQQQLEDLDPDQTEELRELLATEVEIEFEVVLEQDDLPDSITIPQISLLDQSNALNLP